MTNTTFVQYLKNLAAQVYLKPEEKSTIETSIDALRKKLILTFFDSGLKAVRTFGSFDRGTLLSREFDKESDVDVLLVFEEKKWEAQTYLNKLKKFAEDNYTKSDIYQDYPTIVLNLQHIKFEITPCVYTPERILYYEKYVVPKRKGVDIEWIETKPDAIKNKIEEYTENRNKLLELIHIFKYWNCINTYLYKTVDIENFILKHFDSDKGLNYNFFTIINKLTLKNPLDVQNHLNRRAQEHKRKMEFLLKNDMEEYAIFELQKMYKQYKGGTGG